MSNPISTTAERVYRNTNSRINERIRRKTIAHLHAAVAGGPAAIERRLAELDREWDIERCLETGASTLVLVGTALGATSDRRWLFLPIGVAGFLLQHALQGWCPPLPIFRRLGVRTADEINQERFALKALYGGFATVGEGAGVEAAARVVGLKP